MYASKTPKNSIHNTDDRPLTTDDCFRSTAHCPPATERQTWAEIDLQALTQNYSTLCSLIPSNTNRGTSIRLPRIIPVIKANAYGHGAIQVAHALADAGADIFAVGIVEEAVILRKAGISQEILVLGTTWRGQESLALDSGIILAVDSAKNIAALDTAAGKKNVSARIHVKVDTGMGRLGVRWDSLGQIIDSLLHSEHISLEGVFTHLASADKPNQGHTSLQTDRFEKALQEMQKHGLKPKEIHCANSAGLLYHESLRKWSSRIGIALYGYAPDGKRSPVELRPVLSLKTKVGPIRQIPKGESVGYGRRFIASRTTRYATLPIGYADGLPRRLSGNCRVIVRGGFVDVIGTISMDMITLDLTDRPDIREGDEAVLIGRNGENCLTADTWAGALETIPYEILCGIASRVPRIYTQHRLESS